MRLDRLSRTRHRKFCRLAVELLEDRKLLATGVGVYDPSVDHFALRKTATAGPVDAGSFQFPAPGATPVVGDWNGDGRDDFGVFDAASATWSLKYGAEAGSANAGVFPFGAKNAVPVVGDWNGDGRDDIGTYKNGEWQLRFGASPGIADAGTFTFGSGTETPVVGDWNGDGKDGIGLFNPSTSHWRLRQAATANAASAGEFDFGPTGGIAVTGDWNGDGKDGIGVYQPGAARWNLRESASAGTADRVFVFGATNRIPVTGSWVGPAAPADALATVVLPPIDLDLLGLEVRTSPITVTLSTDQGDGQLLGNLLNTVTSLVNLDGASNALNTVLDSTVDLLNSAQLNISGVGQGSLDDATPSASQVLELFVAPVHLDLLGVEIDTSTVRVTITATAGQGLVLGNAVTDLIHLFDPPLPDTLSVDVLNDKLDQLLAKLNQQLPGIAPAPVPAVPISDGQILNVTVPPLDVNLLGLKLETSSITVNASAESGSGALLGNVLTTALKTIDATPQNLSELNTHINSVLAKVVGVLNSADLSVAASAIDALPPALQTLLRPTLTAPAAGASAPVLDLLIASSDGSTPPVDVNLLGLVVTTSNIEAHLSAQTGDGQVLGNLLYNVANLADPGGTSGLLHLLNLLGAGSLNDSGDTADSSVTPPPSPAEQLLTLTVNPLDIKLLGLEIQSDPIIVTVSTQAGDGKLLGNLLNGITSLINVGAVENALNNVLSTTVDLLNSASLIVSGVGSGSFDDAPQSLTPVLDLFVAPVHLDLLGLVATTDPIRLSIKARSGAGLVLGNVVRELAHVFDPPLPDKLDIDDVNQRLQQLIDRLDQQIPNIPSAPMPPVVLENGEFLELTVPKIDLDLLGLLLQTSPITVNAAAATGNGQLLGNVLQTVLNTVDATTENLTGLNTNLNKLLAKVVGVLNASSLVLPSSALDPLLGVLQTLTDPVLVNPTPGATTDILNLVISQGDKAGPPVDVDLLGLNVSTSNIEANLLAKTGDGQILGNLLYNIANLLNPNETSTLLSLLSQLGNLPVPNAPRIKLDGALNFTEQSAALLLGSQAFVTDRNSPNFNNAKLTVQITTGASAGDLLAIRNQGTAAGQIGVTAGKVTFGGALIATFTGGTGSTPLVVTFNAAAKLAGVQALVRNLTFRTLSDNPGDALRSITFKLTDETGLLSNLALVTVQVKPVNDPPTINSFGGAIAFKEDGPAVAIAASSATVTDPDSPNFGGGKLTAKLSSGAGVSDLLFIRQGTLITTDANRRVYYDGQRIASFSGGAGAGATPLVVQFDLHATPAKVAAVLRNIMYRNTSQKPGTQPRTVWVQVTDGDGGHSAAVTKSLSVTAMNDPPVLGISGTVGYQLNSAAIVLAPNATVTDPDSANFAGGKLTVSITSGGDASNRLVIGGSTFTIEGNDVKRNGVIIGTRNANGGMGTTKLEITFNAQALRSYVQELLRALRFSTVSSTSTADRIVTFTLSDGDGGVSASVTKRVDVS